MLMRKLPEIRETIGARSAAVSATQRRQAYWSPFPPRISRATRRKIAWPPRWVGVEAPTSKAGRLFGEKPAKLWGLRL